MSEHSHSFNLSSLIVLSHSVSSLAAVTEGYSAGAIARAIRGIVTNRRVAKLHERGLKDEEFINDLALQDVSYQDDRRVFLAFTRVITGMNDRRKKIESLVSGEADKKKDKKGAKKGKK